MCMKCQQILAEQVIPTNSTYYLFIYSLVHHVSLGTMGQGSKCTVGPAYWMRAGTEWGFQGRMEGCIEGGLPG